MWAALWAPRSNKNAAPAEHLTLSRLEMAMNKCHGREHRYDGREHHYFALFHMGGPEARNELAQVVPRRACAPKDKAWVSGERRISCLPEGRRVAQAKRQ